MREYLFRGKRTDNGEWVEGTYLHLNVGKDYICDGTVWIGTLQPCKYEVDPETVEQYTGFLDMNGKRIFEGDIVGVDGKFYEVLIEKGCWMIAADGGDFLATNNDEIEVIGNIHDNKELLKEGGE